MRPVDLRSSSFARGWEPIATGGVYSEEGNRHWRCYADGWEEFSGGSVARHTLCRACAAAESGIRDHLTRKSSSIWSRIVLRCNP